MVIDYRVQGKFAEVVPKPLIRRRVELPQHTSLLAARPGLVFFRTAFFRMLGLLS